MDALNHVFSKLCELNSCHFNYAACTFGTGSRRKRKKKNDPLRNDGGGDGDSLVMQMQAALLAHNKGGKNADRVALILWILFTALIEVFLVILLKHPFKTSFQKHPFKTLFAITSTQPTPNSAPKRRRGSRGRLETNQRGGGQAFPGRCQGWGGTSGECCCCSRYLPIVGPIHSFDAKHSIVSHCIMFPCFIFLFVSSASRKNSGWCTPTRSKPVATSAKPVPPP